MRLVPNAGTIATTATSMWAAYGAIAIYILDKVVEYLQSPEAAKFTWTQAVLGVLLVAIPILRVWYQSSLATATERKLQAERIAREKLEEVATSEGPPISKTQAKVIKQDAAIEAAGGGPDA